MNKKRDQNIGPSRVDTQDLPVIIINGPPGVGKTTLGKKIADEFKLPFISKDNIKDLLFENLGWEDRAWSQKLGGASVELMYHFAETLLIAHKSFIVETAFRTAIATTQFIAIKDKCPFHPIQIICKADPKTCYERFHKRATSRNRHPGHFDQNTSWEMYRDTFPEDQYGPLDIGGKTIDVDLSNLETMNLNEILHAVRTMLKTTSIKQHNI